MEPETTATKKWYQNKKLVAIWGGVGFVLLIIVIAIFGTPSPEMVFEDMQEEMLQTTSVTLDQNYTNTAPEGTMNLEAKTTLDFASHKELLAKGEFSLDVKSSTTPMTVEASFIAIGDTQFVKYKELSSTNATIQTSFSEIESKLEGEWIKVRENDQFASFGAIPIDAANDVLPVPVANLTATERKGILALIQNDNLYTIEESAKVELAGEPTYKYELDIKMDQFKKAQKAIAGYVDYFKSGEDTNSKVKSLTVWVNIDTKQVSKIEFAGSSKSGEMTGTILFSDYNVKPSIEKPSDYSIEAESIN